jgi:hypothetical protein
MRLNTDGHVRSKKDEMPDDKKPDDDDFAEEKGRAEKKQGCHRANIEWR